jgi:hypothetical protein
MRQSQSISTDAGQQRVLALTGRREATPAGIVELPGRSVNAADRVIESLRRKGRLWRGLGRISSYTA